MERINHALGAAVRDRMLEIGSVGSGARIMRAEVQVPRLDALTWLRAQRTEPMFYWSDRTGEHEFAGCGAVDQILCGEQVDLRALFARMMDRLESCDSESRFFGGLRFAQGGIREPAWECFGAARFVLPRFEVVNEPARSIVACHWPAKAGAVESLLGQIEALIFRLPTDAGMDLVAGRRFDVPDASAWQQAVNATLGRLCGGDLQKLVLARKTVFECTRRLDPLACLQELSRYVDRCYRFCFMPDSKVAYLGASPERLYSRQGRCILTEAIAGTRVRDPEPVADAGLARELMENEKERREHAFVVQGINETLGPLCKELHPNPEVSVLKLRDCQHLMSVFEGDLHDSIGDADLLEVLQPTPAVGGYPTAAAVRELEKIEPFDRGWYAGPIGWVGKSGAEFAVAIRSALLEGSRVMTYAGAGIVQGSVAAEEWRELDNKIRPFTRLLELP